MNTADQAKTLQKQQNTALFINTTRSMMETVPLESLSIRKIAEQAGFHNSTIYLYFKDLDELLMLASMKHFHAYSSALESLSQKNSSPAETFLAIWKLFCDTIFKQPDIFYNFFFGKRSDNLNAIMKKYYTIFPDELNSFSQEIESMYFGNNITERSLRILAPMIQEATLVTEQNLQLINELMTSFCKYKLEQKCKDKSLDSDELKAQILEMIVLVCGIKK